MAKNPAMTGIEVRQGRVPSYRGMVYDARAGRTRKGPWMPTVAAARGWRTDQARTRRSAAAAPLVDEAWKRILLGMQTGHVRTRSGGEYKPSAVEDYASDYRLRVGPTFARCALDELDAPTLQRWIARLLADGASPSVVRKTINVLRVIYRESVALGETATNPTRDLRVPTSSGRRLRVAAPAEADRLLAALEDDAALWAFAFYTGLRRGELAALRGCDVDLDVGVVRVERAFCFKAREYLTPKSEAGVRVVPVVGRLLPFAESVAESGVGLAFGRDATRPFNPKSIQARADAAWSDAHRVTLHDCRHTFASYLIGSGLNAKSVMTLMGHSSISVTFDRYGHLFPGAEDEARDRLDQFLA